MEYYIVQSNAEYICEDYVITNTKKTQEDFCSNNDSNIEPIITENYTQPLLQIGNFQYSQELYLVLFKYLEITLIEIDSLSVKYEPDKGRWLCEYGTVPIETKLSPTQLTVYYRKNSLLRYGLNSHKLNTKKNTFDTICLTNILKLPFNCFIKAGINDRMRSNLRSEICDKAQKMFPCSAKGQTPWNEIYAFNDYDYEILKGIKSWSKFEIVIRKNIYTDKLNVYFNRLSGNRLSSSFVLNKTKESLNSLPAEFNWNLRKNYIQFIESFQTVQSNHIVKYILNEMICREICSYI
jgi:hypothetical protein